MKVGYARVSTNAQDLSMQITALKKCGCEKIFTEKKSAVKERVELDRMFEMLRKGDVLYVWKLDRLGRSLAHLLRLIQDLKEKEVDLVCINGNIDTSSHLGKFFFYIAGAFAEFERDIIIERTKAGIEEAKRKGVVLGRKKGLSEDSENKAKAAAELYEKTLMQPMDICKSLDISLATFYRYLKFQGVSLKNNVGRKKTKKQ